MEDNYTKEERNKVVSVYGEAISLTIEKRDKDKNFKTRAINLSIEKDELLKKSVELDKQRKQLIVKIQKLIDDTNNFKVYYEKKIEAFKNRDFEKEMIEEAKEKLNEMEEKYAKETK